MNISLRGITTMKCPYCAEEIKDGALVCHHCGRDFSIFIPTLQRLRALEVEVAGIRKALGHLTSPTGDGVAVSRDAPVMRTGKLNIISGITVLAAAFGSCFFYWLFKKQDVTIGLALAIGFPAFAGFAFGLIVRGSHRWLYLLLGLLIGTLDFIGAMFIWGDWKWGLPADWPTAAGIYFIGHPVLFFLSSVTADWFERRYFKLEGASTTSTRIATSLAHLGSSEEAGLSRNVEFWKGILSALAPILTLLGTIVTAYFTYLASIAKK